MRFDILDEAADALIEGRYKPWQSRLVGVDGECYCATGVVCKIAEKHGLCRQATMPAWGNKSHVFMYNGNVSISCVPYALMAEIAGTKTYNGVWALIYNVFSEMERWNDDSVPASAHKMAGEHLISFLKTRPGSKFYVDTKEAPATQASAA
jgi:hypothetical protein